MTSPIYIPPAAVRRAAEALLIAANDARDEDGLRVLILPGDAIFRAKEVTLSAIASLTGREVSQCQPNGASA